MANVTYDILWREAMMELLDQLEAENPEVGAARAHPPAHQRPSQCSSSSSVNTWQRYSQENALHLPLRGVSATLGPVLLPFERFLSCGSRL